MLKNFITVNSKSIYETAAHFYDEYCAIKSLIRFLPYGGVWYILYSPRFNKFRNELLKLGGPSREAAWQNT